MGCRTRANAYYGTPMQGYAQVNREVEGNVVRKPETTRSAPLRVQPVQRKRLSRSAQRRLRKQKVRLAAAGVLAAALLIFLCCVMLTFLDTNGKLSDEIYTLENEIEDITIRNDAREYDIHSLIDLNEVIRTATEDLGMVRSNQAQVITYRVKNSEYVQQLAAVPAN